MNSKFIKIASITLSIVGALLGLAENYIDDKKLDSKIAEQVAKALAEKGENK